jgi:hypothetical protein
MILHSPSSSPSGGSNGRTSWTDNKNDPISPLYNRGMCLFIFYIYMYICIYVCCMYIVCMLYV